MSAAAPSHTYFYPNKMGRVYLLSLKEVLIGDGYFDLLKRTGLSRFEDTLPPDNWTKGFSFDSISSLNQGIEQYYGPRGGRRLALLAGQKFFELGSESFGRFAGLNELALKGKSLPEKLNMGLASMARLMNEVSDQTTWIEEVGPQRLNYHVGMCPVCWTRLAEEPICFYHVGFLKGTLSWCSSGLDFRVRQTSCIAVGDEQCVFRIDTVPIK
ncbi:MAG: 4-vinyl reductase [Candidatus Promineifilaceae bacterium]|nr:4-vinyl reductase [Candidatus Promineifilaceae bacterium]